MHLRARHGCVLLRVVCGHWQVEDECHPIPVDEEEERQEAVDRRFGNDVGVEAVAEVYWVDVITVEVPLACIPHAAVD